MHYSLKDFSHFVLDFVKTVYHSYRSESTGFALAAFIDRKEIVKIEMIRAMMADNRNYVLLSFLSSVLTRLFSRHHGR